MRFVFHLHFNVYPTAISKYRVILLTHFHAKLRYHCSYCVLLSDIDLAPNLQKY